MSPPHDAVDGFFISYILNDITGMLERKFYFIPFHGEDAAVSFGQCMNRTGKMGGICCDSQLLIMLRVGTIASPELKSMEAWKMVS